MALPARTPGHFPARCAGVVGRDHVHRAVEDALDERLPVGLRAQGRVHLEAAVLAQVVLGQHEVVRCGLAGDVQPLRLRPADKRHALLGGHVAHMIGAACLAHQLEIALQLPPLTLAADALVPVGAGIRAVVDVTTAKQGVVLAVRGKDLAEMSALGHRLAHHALGLHAAPVVGKGDDVWCHARKVCKPLALFADRDRPIGMDMNEGVLLDERALERERFGAVGTGFRFGMAAM